MCAPFEHPAAFAFESAIDELAYALDRDPVAFRLANDAVVDPLTGKAFFIAPRDGVSDQGKRDVRLGAPHPRRLFLMLEDLLPD